MDAIVNHGKSLSCMVEFRYILIDSTHHRKSQILCYTLVNRRMQSSRFTASSGCNNNVFACVAVFVMNVDYICMACLYCDGGVSYPLQLHKNCFHPSLNGRTTMGTRPQCVPNDHTTTWYGATLSTNEFLKQSMYFVFVI
uniref:Innexin n=1 Tax=Heterorhabditis bacteriophora TaxID=37862 RepID=A0A1I7WN25_HETBA